MSPKVSIIVPVYKAEKYLHRCLDSIIAQTFKDWELLLVDDGSPDNSGKLCDEYAQKDSRIKVFHKKNGGVSSARQMGLDNATGEYTIHADPDDWVEPTMLEELYAKAIEDNADMVICDYFNEYTDRQVYTPSKYVGYLDSDYVFRQILSTRMAAAVWNKLIRRSVIISSGAMFPPISYAEDAFFVCQVLRFKPIVTYFNKAFYHYDHILNSSSLSRFVSESIIKDRLYFDNYFSSALDAKEYAEELLLTKRTTKELAWFVPNFSRKEFIQIHPEINTYYLNKKTGFRIWKLDFFIKLTLLGHDRISRFLYNLICLRTIPFVKKIIHR